MHAKLRWIEWWVDSLYQVDAAKGIYERGPEADGLSLPVRFASEDETEWDNRS